MDTPQWPQVNIGGGGGGVSVRPVENPAKPASEKKRRPEKEQPLNCPRCNSTNTKFCYYNNYSLSQPRYFCKTCRRYWTEGGTLRNVPVGGGSRKNRRPSAAAAAVSNISSPLLSVSEKVTPNLSIQKISSISSPNNPRIQQGEDLSLGFNQSFIYNQGSEFLASPFGNPNQENPNFNPNSSDLRIMETTSLMSSGGMISSLISMPVSDPNPVYSSSSGFPIHDFKASLNISLDGFPIHHQNGYGNLQVVQDHTRTLISPIDEVKASDVPGSSNDHQFGLQETRQLGDSSSNNGCWQMAEGSWLRHII